MFDFLKKNREKKSLIFPRYNIGYSKNSSFALCIYLEDDDLKKIHEINISNIYIQNSDLFLLIGEHYIVFHELKEFVLKSAMEKKLIYYFFDLDGNSLPFKFGKSSPSK